MPLIGRYFWPTKIYVILSKISILAKTLATPTIHIIHLPHRTDRYAHLMQEFQSQGITNYRIWGGILDKQIPFRGINLAHKQIVQYAKETGLPEILIGEDDLKFTCSRSFQYFLENKPQDYDLYLSSVYNGLLLKDNTVQHFCGMTLYFINQRFYDIFLSVPEVNNIDAVLRNKGRFVVCNPFTAIQINGFSDHKSKNCNYDHLLKGYNLLSC